MDGERERMTSHRTSLAVGMYDIDLISVDLVTTGNIEGSSASVDGISIGKHRDRWRNVGVKSLR